MKIISNPTQVEIKKAAQALKNGHLVAFPTETVYGLGADATNERAVGRVYSVKARPTDHPLIVHISSINQLSKWAVDIPEYAIKLAKKFWPGPMTLILKRSDIAKDFITGGQENVGIRVPTHPVALELLGEFEKLGGFGIAAPSANRFGAVSPTSASDVKEELELFLSESDFILDGGISTIGIESTIVDCLGDTPLILRSGIVTKKDIEWELELRLPVQFPKKNFKFSGSFEKHYAPKCQIILGIQRIEGAGFLALSDIETPVGLLRLSSPNSLNEYARNLYSTFRLADKINLSTLVVVPPLGDGLAVAINERLTKAAVLR